LFEKAAMVSGSPPYERAVRGGSWVNPPGSTSIESRGSLPPETSSPFVGFRPVIVPKREK
jgi:formylglycine-generating enzyme required for sulfatase activity